MLPALVDVKIEQHFAKDGAFDAVPYAPLIALLEAALAAYPTAPRIHWFLFMNDHQTLYTHFADTVRRGMPEAHSAGRLTLEAVMPSMTSIKRFPI
ncbi:hypothetical protein B0H12DRAFT_1150544 [Mycena haematopus]|nr:hypothetical protein B0H12DRAFT_1150544 [Mycena haematopus]